MDVHHTKILDRDGRPVWLADRFLLREKIEGGSPRRTLLAEERDGRRVVIKFLAADTSWASIRARLAHEATLMHQSPIPKGVADYRLQEDGDLDFLVRAYQPGESLKRRLEQGVLSVPEALTLASSMLEVLARLHGLGLLHRNLKPGNVIIPGGDLAAPMLVDSGWDDGALADENGTWRSGPAAFCAYLAPEQAGSIDYDVGEWSDLYAVGTLLIEALTGRPLIEADNVSAALLRQLTMDLPNLGDFGVDAPQALENLLHRLLEKDPRRRYQSAAGALADVRAIAEAVRRGDADPRMVLGVSDRRLTLADPAFVGRERELRRLEQLLEESRREQPVLAFVEGESGSGKSRLLSEFVTLATRRGAWVLRGQGVNEGQRPFQVADGVIRRCAAAAARDEHVRQTLRRVLADDRETVVEVMPVLADALEWGNERGRQIEAFGEHRSIRAFAALLRALGQLDRPVVVLLDDCQWADELTFKCLAQWQRDVAEQVAGRALVLVAFRCEEAPREALRRLRPDEHFVLGPLRTNDMKRLLESMSGPLPFEALETVLRLAEGSPFMASAVLRGVVESGALTTDSRGWRIDEERWAHVQSSDEAAAVLMRRIELLPEDTAQLLTRAAILGKEFDLQFAAFLAEQELSQSLKAMDEARRRRLVWLRGGAARAVFFHDRIRAALLERLDDEQLRLLHRRAAERLQETNPDAVFELAFHFDAGGRSDLALPYALQAAEQARARHALESAEEHYRIAERGCLRSDHEVRYRITEGLGDVLMLRGRYEAAAHLFQEAAELADGRLAQAHVAGKLGELAYKRGDMEESVVRVEQALGELDVYVPGNALAMWVMLLWQVCIQALHSVFPSLLVETRKKPASDEQLLKWRLLSCLARGYWFVRSKRRALCAHLRSLNMAEKYAPTLELAQAYSDHAPAMTLIGWYRRGAAYALKSLQIRRLLGDVWGQGQSLSFHGVLLYASSQYRACVDRCREAVQLLERTGDYWEMHMARYQLAASLYRLGDLPGAVREARAVYRSGIELGDEQASGIILDVWARASEGDLPEELLATEMQRQRPDAQGRAQVLMAEGIRLLNVGRLEQAAATFQEALDLARKAGVFNVYVAPNLAWLATALRRQVEEINPYAKRRRRALLRRAERAAKRALATGRWFRNDLPHALREFAYVQALKGNFGVARRWFNKSLAEAERQHAEYEKALTLRARATVGRDLGWVRADEDERAARLSLLERHAGGAGDIEETRTPTISLADRFSAALESGRRMAATLDAEAVLREAQQAAERLLRSQWTGLATLDRDRRPQLTGDAGNGDAPLEAWCRSALREGQAIAFRGDQTEAAAGFEEFPGSAICAPIFVRGRPVACLFAHHRDLPDYFGRDEERLADFITAIAGAALENAAGFRELQRLNATLEQRVAERTRAAETRARELAASNRRLEKVLDELRERDEQLRVAKEAAERASVAKSAFLATMSHEIRTPMNGIVGMTELMFSTPINEIQRGFMRNIKQSARFLMELLNDILDLSKIEAGGVELESVPFDLREMASDAVQALASQAFQKGVEVVLDVSPTAPASVVGDPGRLRQVVVNLVNNAIKFTESGEILVGIHLVKRKTGAAVLRFDVKDTGVGIPPEKQAVIFDAFRQADSSTTRRYGGTGLGLTISTQLVQAMGGRIQLESRIGAGSRFFFEVELPCGDEPPAMVCPALQGAAVLVVDPNPAARLACKRLLGSLGLRVRAVADAEAAIQSLRKAPPNTFTAIIADSRLNLRGRPLTSVVRQLVEGRIPVVSIAPAAALADSPDVAAVMIKPLRHVDLLDTLHRITGTDTVAVEIQNREAVGHSVRSLKILLAEDGEINRDVAVGLLEMQGHTVQAAVNGKEALAAFETGDFDAVLMDLEMPEMDGLTASRAIRAFESVRKAPRTPIIAMTAHAFAGMREKCRDAGMDEYVTKPVDPDELATVLHRVGGVSSTETSRVVTSP